MLKQFKAGLEALKSYSKLWVILWLIVIFPAVFIFAFLDVHGASKDNVRSLELRRISTLHDTIESLIISGVPLANVLPNLHDDESDISDLKVAEDTADGLLIIADIQPEFVGKKATDTKTYRVALLNPGETYIAPVVIEGKPVDHAYRYIETTTGGYVIFSAHDFSDLDALLAARTTNSTFALFVIFAFIIGLAYWVAKQINYQTLFAKAKDKLQERDLFSSSLAHELRSPLTAIKGYASLIRESGVKGDLLGYTETIESSADRLIALIGDFLEAARLQSGKLALTIVEVDLNTLVLDTVAQLTPVATAKNLTLVAKPAVTKCVVKSDDKRLTQVITNIVSNSLKYTAEGTVTVTITPGRRLNTITVADTGFGISAEDQRKLFAPFARVGDESKQAEITGTGLGMWITKQIITELGGSIEVESIKGVGTHVIISVPHTAVA